MNILNFLGKVPLHGEVLQWTQKGFYIMYEELPRLLDSSNTCDMLGILVIFVFCSQNSGHKWDFFATKSQIAKPRGSNPLSSLGICEVVFVQSQRIFSHKNQPLGQFFRMTHRQFWDL